jgi:hypothetical protein
MTSLWRRSIASRLFAVALLAVLPLLAGASPRAAATKAKAPIGEEVDVFDAMKNDQIEVKFIAKDSNKANLVIKNKTDKPLTIKVPDAFAGVPVLAQVADPNAAQGVGGGATGAGFNIAPEKTRKIDVACLCLDHGKPNPNSRMAYELKPIAAVTDKPEIALIVAQHSKGEVSTAAAQAAAWHVQNGLSWEQLTAKRLEHARGPSEPYFKAQDLAVAKQMVERAEKSVKVQAKSADKAADSPGAYSPK